MEKYIDIDARIALQVFGSFDAYAKKIEKNLNVNIVSHGDEVKVSGNENNVCAAISVLETLSALAKRGNEITEQNVDYAISIVDTGAEKKYAAGNKNGDGELASPSTEDLIDLDAEIVARTFAGKVIKAKTFGQKHYVDEIRDKMICFGIGPAGTGKTFLAMAMAITAFKNNDVNRIILTRPAIEAGEKLGFLPGDLQSKVDPYLRPLYDALYQIMGAESFNANMEKGLIEVAPLAYMRGRTLDNAFIILDEAQNTTPAQMKMFLTRIGFGSKVVITGDLTQKDLPNSTVSGLDVAMKVLSKLKDDIAFVELTSKDVVRHPLVQKIVNAYEIYEKANEKARERGRKAASKENTKGRTRDKR